MKRKTDRAVKPRPKPTLRELLKDQLGAGDLELTDLYNRTFGSSYPSPLSDKQVKQLYEREIYV